MFNSSAEHNGTPLTRASTMNKLFSIKRIGSFHSRTRKLVKRYAIQRGDMSFMLHIGKRSFYFYPATCKRPIKPSAVFK